MPQRTAARKSASRSQKRHIPRPVRRAVKARDGLRCVYCQRGGKMTLDHIVPVIDGGRSVPENLVCACKRCNLRKGTTDLDLFAIWLERRTGEPVAVILGRVADHVALPLPE